MAGNVDYVWCVKWKVDKPGLGTSRRSPEFSFRNSEWYLQLSFNKDGYYYLNLLNKYNKEYKDIIVTTSIENYTDKTSKLSTTWTVCKSTQVLWKYSPEQISSVIPNFSATSKFTIICIFHCEQPVAEKKDVSTEAHLSSSLSPTVVDNLQSFSRDLIKSLRDETFSDVKLKCGDRTFTTHRSLLASRSEVFAAMFRNKMAETDTGIVDIKDMDPEVLQMLLEYMYSGKWPDLCGDTARLLYEASDKYAVFGLKNACSEWMLRNQTEENCLHFLVLADEHSDENFKEGVVSFVAEHLPLLSTEYWSAFKNDHPVLALAVVEKRLAEVQSSQAA